MLYWLEHDTTPKYQYAYKDISLVGYSYSVCPQCNRQYGVPQYIHEIPHLLLEGNGEYPDYLQFCGAGRQLCLISEQALDVFEKNRVTGYSGYQLVASESLCQNRSNGHIPNYYYLSVTGQIDLDLAEMRLKKKRVCSHCGQFEWSRMRLEPFLLNHTMWDKSDICLVTSVPGLRVCSENLKHIIQNNRLNGFSFRMSSWTD